MFKLLILYVHLLATCTALGVIIATDLRLLGKATSRELRISPPNPYVEQLVAAALLTLYVTGGILVWFGLQERPDYLSNEKLLAKLMLVGLLTANAFVLHRHTFKRLTRPRPLSSWSRRDRFGIALPVATSNGLWMFCAFLGIARPWNFSMPLDTVLAIGLGVVVAAMIAVLAMLSFAARRGVAMAPAEIEPTEFVPRSVASTTFASTVLATSFAPTVQYDMTREMAWAGMPEPTAAGALGAH